MQTITGTKKERLSRLLRNDWLINQVDMYIGTEFNFAEDLDSEFSISSLPLDQIKSFEEFYSNTENGKEIISETFSDFPEIRTFNDLKSDTELSDIIDFAEKTLQEIISLLKTQESKTIAEAHSAYNQLLSEKKRVCKDRFEPTTEEEDAERDRVLLKTSEAELLSSIDQNREKLDSLLGNKKK